VTTFNKTSSNRLDVEYYRPKYGKILSKIEEVVKDNLWELKRIREISEPLRYGTSEKLTYIDKGIPFLRITDVKNVDFERFIASYRRRGSKEGGIRTS